MSPRVRPVAAGAGGGRVALTVLAVAVVAIGMLLVVRSRPAPDPLDPRSGRPDGTRGLVLLLEEQGATVTIGRDVPSAGEEVRVLVLVDRLDDAQRAELLAFVEAGGVAVVADPASALHGGAGGELVSGATPTGAGSAESEANVANTVCTIGAAEHLRGLFVDEGRMFAVRRDEPQCFGDGAGRAFVVRRDIGAGSIAGLGDNRIFSNARLRYADNSGLGVALLAPRPGAVHVLLGESAARTPDDIGTGDETLRDLVRPGVWMALAQFALAFVGLSAARGIRVGRPVEEDLAAPVAGSEFVRARAAAMQRAGHAASAGATLRDDFARELADLAGLPRGASVKQVVGVVEERTGVERSSLEAVIGRPTPDPSDLLELANDLAALRVELGLRRPPTDRYRGDE